MTNAALTPADMTFSERFSTAGDWLASLRNVNDVQAAYEDVFWSVINTKEFMFNH